MIIAAKMAGVVLLVSRILSLLKFLIYLFDALVLSFCSISCLIWGPFPLTTNTKNKFVLPYVIQHLILMPPEHIPLEVLRAPARIPMGSPRMLRTDYISQLAKPWDPLGGGRKHFWGEGRLD